MSQPLISLNEWDEVARYVDSEFKYPASFVSRAASGDFDKDAFSLGQLASKAWLLKEYAQYSPVRPHTLALLASWYGVLAEPLLIQTPQLERVWGFDIYPHSVRMSDQFNQHLVVDGWRYKGVVDDILTINWKHPEFVVNGTLIDTKPSVIVNTSCEHMHESWLDSVGTDQLVVLQSNNNRFLDGHINITESLDQLLEKYPLSKILFKGSMKLPLYTRYMLIGYK